MFNIKQVPFSRFGSYMSIVFKKQQLVMCNHHNKLNDLFILTPLSDGQPVEGSYTGTPERLTLQSAAGKIEICFESTGTLRVRGTGLGLRIESLSKSIVAYSEAPHLATLNVRPALRRYQVESLKGPIAITGLYGEKKSTGTDAFEKTCGAASVVVAPDSSDTFELAVDEYWSTWQPPARKPFEACLAAAEKSFEAFLSSMPPAPPAHAPARRLAAYINWSCTVEPCGLFLRHAMLMSKNWMCNVWSWDQSFNAMALAAGQPELALDQMLVLVDHQDQFGAYPDSINDMLKHYNYSKPPVHGWAFREILKRLPTPPGRAIVETMYNSLSAQANWWMTHRRLNGRALPYYLHGNDSGWDNSTMFDRGVPLNAPDLASLLVLQMDTLAELASQLGKTDDQEQWKKRADMLLKALLDELWQEDHFIAKLAKDGRVVPNQSLIPWLPIILGKRLPAELLARLAAGIERHLTEWGLATEHIDSPEYNANGYWRGPIWAPATYIAVSGLSAAGYTELADRISERFCRLCSKSGFAENFDALTGASLHDPAYTWTSSVFLLLAERIYLGKAVS